MAPKTDFRNWSPFRAWVHKLWVENCEEHNLYGGDRLGEAEYFRQYRWWLRREYRYQHARQIQLEEKQRKFGKINY